jgi:hypothetical protein
MRKCISPRKNGVHAIRNTMARICQDALLPPVIEPSPFNESEKRTDVLLRFRGPGGSTRPVVVDVAITTVATRGSARHTGRRGDAVRTNEALEVPSARRRNGSRTRPTRRRRLRGPGENPPCLSGDASSGGTQPASTYRGRKRWCPSWAPSPQHCRLEPLGWCPAMAPT